jgi:hypothetical protein
MQHNKIRRSRHPDPTQTIMSKIMIQRKNRVCACVQNVERERYTKCKLKKNPKYRRLVLSSRTSSTTTLRDVHEHSLETL